MIAVNSQCVSQSTRCFWEWLFFQFFVSFFCMLSNMHTCSLSWYVCHLANLSAPPRFHLMQKVTEKLWHKGQSLAKTWFGSGGETQRIIGSQKIKEEEEFFSPFVQVWPVTQSWPFQNFPLIFTLKPGHCHSPLPPTSVWISLGGGWGGRRWQIVDKWRAGPALLSPTEPLLSADNSPDANDQVAPLLSLTYHARRLMYWFGEIEQQRDDTATSGD